MADDLTDEERELLAKHRASKRPSHTVRIRGKHENSGAEYEFDIDDERADKIVAKHSELWADDEEESEEEPAKGGKAKPVAGGEVRRFGRRVG